MWQIKNLVNNNQVLVGVNGFLIGVNVLLLVIIIWMFFSRMKSKRISDTNIKNLQDHLSESEKIIKDATNNYNDQCNKLRKRIYAFQNENGDLKQRIKLLENEKDGLIKIYQKENGELKEEIKKLESEILSLKKKVN